MNLYGVLKFLHVLLAIVAVGTNVTYGVWISRAARDSRYLAFTLKGIKILDDRVANPAYGLLLLTGLAMLHFGGHSWTTPWLLVSLILYAVMVVLAVRGYTPSLRRQIAVLEAGGPDSPEYRALAASATRLGVALSIIVVAIVFLMVTKPTLWG